MTPSNHLATSETNPDGHTATPHYNAFDQLTSETLFDGTSTTSIDPAQSNGLLAEGHSGSLPSSPFEGSVTDPNGHTTTVVFDRLGHPIETIDPNGGTTFIAHDWAGFPSSVTDPLGRTPRIPTTTPTAT